MSDLTPSPLQRLRARQIPHAIPLRIESRRRNVKTGGRDKQRVSWRPVFLIALGIPISLAIGIALGPLLNAATRNAGDMKEQPASLAESVDQHARSVPSKRSSGATRDAAAAHPVSNEPAVHASLVSAEADEDTAEPLLQDTQEADQNPPRSVREDSTESQSADAAPPAAPVQSEKIVCSTAASGQPFGVGKVDILFGDGARPTVYPDQPVLFDESDIRARFMVFDAEPVAADDSSPHAARRVTVHFLFLGDEPLEIRCATLADVLLEDVTVVPEDDMVLHARLLDEWWQTIYTHMHSTSPEKRPP